VTVRERRLEAPHRRPPGGPRLLEKATVLVYRATTRVIAALPPAFARAVIGGLAQASYLLWPTKRGWSNRNFGHVLGLPPDHPRVRRLALAAYAEYGRYLVELMRLGTIPPAEVGALVDHLDVERVAAIVARSKGGLILTVGHVGNNDAVAASIARYGFPIAVIADDSSFPELFDLLRRQRESWGATVIGWRNLRGMFTILRRREMLALLVDWGYRDDGIPVRLFDAWTTLPAGPATLAARSKSLILPITVVRLPDGHFEVSWPEPIEVTSSDPAELQRASQAIADALAATIGRAPEQWYSFKPIWPATAEEAAELERRARIMQAGRPDPGPARRHDGASPALSPEGA